MNDDFKHFPPPPDEADDPLLHALRQHLGEDFGQAPPARLWAGIRQQLPAAVRPWWRRPRRLLPLLALLLLSTVAVWQVGRQRSASRARPGQPLAERALPSARPTSSATPATPSAGAAATPQSEAASGPKSAPAAAADYAAAATAGRAVPEPASTTRSRSKAATAASASPPPAAGATGAHGSVLAGTRKRVRRHPGQLADASVAAVRGGELPGSATAATRPESQRTSVGKAAHRQLGATASATRHRSRLTIGALATHTAPANRHRTNGLEADKEVPLAANESASGRPAAGRGRRPAPELAGPVAAAPESTAGVPPLSLALLDLRLPQAQGTLPGPPAPLTTPEAPPGPWLQPGRRWAVQVVAGPTLSYRSIRAASTGGGKATAVPQPTVAGPSTSTSVDTSGRVGLERAAVGWGAQVQVQRALTGRWALAAGLGYHEYATYLSLDVTTRTYNYTAGLSSNFIATTTAVRQRDTYRVLTLPVQLRYALAPSRGRLALGVLGGLEPSLYVGGRTTEGSSCACEQQTFSSATNSPYNSLSLALSLGLDVRYHLGGPASRWTLLAQPTGRYVASTFVRSPGWGYALRQPYSLGLLTGVAWEW